MIITSGIVGLFIVYHRSRRMYTVFKGMEENPVIPLKAEKSAGKRQGQKPNPQNYSLPVEEALL